MSVTFDKIVTKTLRTMCFIIFLLLIIVVFSQVFLRYFFHAPLAWSDELARLLLVWVSFLGVTLVHFSDQGHPAVRALLNKFSEQSRKAIDLGVNLLLVFGFIAIFIASYKYTMSNTKMVSAVLHYPNSLKYAVVPLSMALMTIKSITRTINDCKNLRSHEKTEAK